MLIFIFSQNVTNVSVHPKSKSMVKLQGFVKSYSDNICWIANGWILHRGGVPSKRRQGKRKIFPSTILFWGEGRSFYFFIYFLLIKMDKDTNCN